MRETTAIIERISRISNTHQHLTLAVEPSLTQMKAGQALLARAHEGWSPYLCSTWYPVLIGKNTLTVERPAHERYEPGATVTLLAPVGKPFRFRKTLRTVLLMAYNCEPTPLLMTVPALLANRVGVTLLLLGSAVEYGTAHLPAEVEVLKGDADLNWANRVTTVGWADQVMVVVATDNEASRFRQVWELFRELRADIPENYLFAVSQAPLPCGVGACAACMIKVKGGTHTFCTDGAAIDMREMLFRE